MQDARIRVLTNNMNRDNDDLQVAIENFEEDVRAVVSEYLEESKGIPHKLVRPFTRKSLSVKRVMMAIIEDYTELNDEQTH